MELNIIKVIFIMKIIPTLLLVCLNNFLNKFSPKFVTSFFLYGKTTKSDSYKAYTPKVPKRWFKHFYQFAAIWSTLTLAITASYYFGLINEIPQNVQFFIHFLRGGKHEATVSSTATFLALVLLTLQSYKRFYETHYVNIFSNSEMDLLHYIAGYTHYFGSFVAIIMESPGFARPGDFSDLIQIKEISSTHLISSIIFIWAWWKQFQSANILAKLRKNKKGEVITKAHLIPEGGLFEYISSPLNFCEILMYICLGIILYGNSVFPYVTLWVFSNQFETALLTHWWYQGSFKNYPKNRKSLIPFVL